MLNIFKDVLKTGEMPKASSVLEGLKRLGPNTLELCLPEMIFYWDQKGQKSDLSTKGQFLFELGILTFYAGCRAMFETIARYMQQMWAWTL